LTLPRQKCKTVDTMARQYVASDAHLYRMQIDKPRERLEPEEKEIEIVDDVLRTLVEAGILPRRMYDKEKVLAHREAVAEWFEIPWTAITPRLQRLIYAINAIVQPRRMIAAGIFCGNTFISNAGAAVGPGKVYDAEDLVGVEIVPSEAERAEKNMRKIDPTGEARIVVADAVDVVRHYRHPIDLLYLDADGDEERGKGIYLDILKAAKPWLHPGSVVLAHNSVNCTERLRNYLAYVRDPANMKASVNVVIDGEGLEVSVA